MSCVVVVIASLGALAVVPAGPAAAQSDSEPSAAQRCFEHHQFGAQPVDVAKTADGETVLAQVSWGHHPSIGCFLSLDDTSLAALRAAPAPQSLPTAETEASQRCFEHHQFGQRPVDVAKTADKQTVLARLSWGHHNTIGCYLTLDNAALATLRTAAATPTPDPPADTYTAIAAGDWHSCAIRPDGTIACWGDNEHGQTDTPQGRYTAITAGSVHSCAIRPDGTVACWGDNEHGQTDTPEGRYTAIAAGFRHSCAISTNETIACWGLNSSGRADAPEGWYTAIAAGGAHSCAIKADETIACWGDNEHGQTDGPEGRYTAIAAANSHSCAIKAD